MTRRRTPPAVGLLVVLGWLLLGQVLLAGPASAHAELLSTSPANGERLEAAPHEVLLRFSESVGLVEGGLRLIDARDGDPVGTAEPLVDGATVRLPLPADLPDGSYVVSWRVVSEDSHPVSGAFSFGVGRDAAPVTEGVVRGGAPWPVVVARWAGYVGFALVAGVVTVAVWCWPAGRGDRRTTRLLAAGLAVGGVSTLLGLLLEGPYQAGVSSWRLLDTSLMGPVAHARFGAWMELRMLLYLAIAGVVAGVGVLSSALNRAAAVAGVVAVAVTFPGTGHAVTGGVLDQGVDVVHVLAAGVWVGGLVTLATYSLAAGARPGPPAYRRFSLLALGAVGVLVVTGVVNAVIRLDSVAELWSSRYGWLLVAKLALVVVVVAVAAVSRRTVARDRDPWRTVRVEAIGTVGVLAVTAALTLTAPPPTSTAAGSSGAAAGARSSSVTMDLGDGRRAEVRVGEASAGARPLVVRLVDADGRPVRARRVALQATLPDRDLGPFDVAMTRDDEVWRGTFRFPFPGRWRLVLTVDEPRLAAVVTAGRVTIG